jgi:elongation factor Ts
MAEITMELIKELRHKTGVGVGKCKEALEEAHGDLEEAVAILRKKGMASAVKKEDREAKEGIIGVAETDKCVAFVEVNAETDFVVQNERFRGFLNDVAQEAAKTMPADLESFLKQKAPKDDSHTIDELRASVIQAIGENVQISRILVIPKSDKKTIGFYSHMGGKLVTAVVIEGDNKHADLARDISMHIAAASPEYLNPEEVPEKVIEQERDIAKEQMKGKPAEMIEKILQGKMNKFYDEVCLTHQKYIKDDSISIKEMVKKAGPDLKISKFLRWQVGQHR